MFSASPAAPRAKCQVAHPDATALASGAILSNYQRIRIEHVCGRLGLVSLAYLWQQPQTPLLESMFRSGLSAILVKVAGVGLGVDLVGRDLQSTMPALRKLVSSLPHVECQLMVGKIVWIASRRRRRRVRDPHAGFAFVLTSGQNSQQRSGDYRPRTLPGGVPSDPRRCVGSKVRMDSAWGDGNTRTARNGAAFRRSQRAREGSARRHESIIGEASCIAQPGGSDSRRDHCVRASGSSGCLGQTDG